MISIRTVINVSCTLHPQSVVSLLACAQRAVFHIKLQCQTITRQLNYELFVTCTVTILYSGTYIGPAFGDF